jgi:hypothetical protein
MAGLTLAGLPEAGPAQPSRLDRLRADLALIEALVDGGLKLAGEENPLRRAESCNSLAEKVAREVKRATAAKDRTRAADLGRQLQALLERGVARNLGLAQSGMPEDSLLIPEMRRLGEKAVAAMAPAMEDLEGAAEADSPEMRQALQGLSRARAEVERVILGPPKSPNKKRNGSER